MKSISLLASALAALALAVAPPLVRAEFYTFKFFGNPLADQSSGPSPLDVLYRFRIDSRVAPVPTHANLDESSYWKNGGYVLDLTHDGKTVRFNDAIVSTEGPVQVQNFGSFTVGYGLFAIDLHGGTPFVDDNGLPYDPFVYGRITPYADQKPYQDLQVIAVTGSRFLLDKYKDRPAGETTSQQLYRFTFIGNPGADAGSQSGDPNDITYRLTLDLEKLSSLDVASLNKTDNWLNGAIELDLIKDGRVISLNAGVDPNSGLPEDYPWGVRFRDGYVEIGSSVDGFFDVDLHPGFPGLDFQDPKDGAFIFGRIEVYDDQQAFRDLYEIVVNGDRARLGLYALSAPVPEPETWSLFAAGLFLLAGGRLTVRRGPADRARGIRALAPR